MKFNTRYVHDIHPGKYFEGVGRTKQAEAAACDINNIMAKYAKTGVLEHAKRYEGQYGDFTSVEDFHSNIQTIVQADEAFLSLPAKVRKRFDNDPANFLAFATDDANYDEMIEMGLLTRPVGYMTEKEKYPSGRDASVAEGTSEA